MVTKIAEPKSLPERLHALANAIGDRLDDSWYDVAAIREAAAEIERIQVQRGIAFGSLVTCTLERDRLREGLRRLAADPYCTCGSCKLLVRELL